MFRLFREWKRKKMEKRKQNYKDLFDYVYSFCLDFFIAKEGYFPSVKTIENQVRFQILIAILNGRVTRDYEVVK